METQFKVKFHFVLIEEDFRGRKTPKTPDGKTPIKIPAAKSPKTRSQSSLLTPPNSTKLGFGKRDPILIEDEENEGSDNIDGFDDPSSLCYKRNVRPIVCVSPFTLSDELLLPCTMSSSIQRQRELQRQLQVVIQEDEFQISSHSRHPRSLDVTAPSMAAANTAKPRCAYTMCKLLRKRLQTENLETMEFEEPRTPTRISKTLAIPKKDQLPTTIMRQESVFSSNRSTLATYLLSIQATALPAPPPTQPQTPVLASFGPRLSDSVQTPMSLGITLGNSVDTTITITEALAIRKRRYI
jgi:hypothetical protein